MWYEKLGQAVFSALVVLLFFAFIYGRARGKSLVDVLDDVIAFFGGDGK